MRTFLNAWLRKWAEGSLRNEVYRAQEKVLILQRKLDNITAHTEKQIKDLAASDAKKRKNDLKNYALAKDRDSRLIKALKERMPPELFLSVLEYVRAKEDRGGVE